MEKKLDFNHMTIDQLFNSEDEFDIETINILKQINNNPF